MEMKFFIKSFLTPVYYYFWKLYIVIMGFIFKTKITNGFDIPIIINNRDRLTFLKKLIESLEHKGYKNIFIIDNDSDYQPLLNYYENCQYKIFRLDKNIGYLALWQTDIYKHFIKDFYVYTDSDVVPTETCPNNFLNQFFQVMKSDKNLMKIGLSLNIDDLPNHFSMKHQVIDWEQQYWQKESDDNRFYIANVDTTFALYRPFMKGGASRLKMYRSKKPFSAYHMPWYNDSANLSDEEKFYIESAKTSTHWTAK